MISHRQFIVLSLTSFGVSFSLLIAGIVFQIMGTGGSNSLMLAGFPFNFIGILAMWFGLSLKQQSERLDRLEAQLLARAQE
jgi:sulfite exporter TauE/SafE